jgi:HSP20 family protein
MSDSSQMYHYGLSGEPLTAELYLQPRQEGNFKPRVDLLEKENNLYLYFELPGLVNVDDIEINLCDRNLYIKGQVNQTVQEGLCHSQERRYGNFFRDVFLPVAVQAKGATANYTHGILEVKLKQKDTGKGSRIKVRLKEA